ncbi:unnamed protein product [Leuciscus chuanchicus]
METSKIISSDKATVVIQVNPQVTQNIVTGDDGQETRGAQHNTALTGFFKAQPKALGTVQIMIGVVVFLLGIVHTSVFDYPIRYPHLSLISGITYWGSLIFISAGSLSVAAQNKLHLCVVKASLIVNVFSAITAGIVIVLMSIEIEIISSGGGRYGYDRSLKRYDLGISGIMLVFSITQFIISICISGFACKVTCNRGSTVVNVALNQTALLLALASIKRVGDLQAFSVDESCLEFAPDFSHVVLRPRPGYVPKVPTTPFRDQVVNLQALPPEEADPALALLCPVLALRCYIDRTQSFRTSDQLFVCYGGQQKGKAVSKQRLAHWLVDAIVRAYESQDVPCPPRLRAHSTRSVTSSWALAQGASLTDICRAAGWATPNTFARFYSLRVEPVSSRVLASASSARN